MNFLLGMIVDVVKDSWEVKIGHVLESELPKLFIFVWIVSDMFSRVFVSSAVTEPDIESSVGSHKCRGSEIIINDPAVRRVEKSMLEEDWLETFNDGGAFSLNPIDSQNVAIFSGNLVFLERVFEVGTVLLKFQLGFRMNG
jgi:hypothetical protein